jgi:DNA polymerase III delta prime subunit
MSHKLQHIRLGEMMKAVIDRFEGEYAILIVGDDEQRLNVSRKLLPKEVKEGNWLQVDIVGGEVSNITVDEPETEKARQRIAEKLARLRKGDYK